MAAAFSTKTWRGLGKRSAKRRGTVKPHAQIPRACFLVLIRQKCSSRTSTRTASRYEEFDHGPDMRIWRAVKHETLSGVVVKSRTSRCYHARRLYRRCKYDFLSCAVIFPNAPPSAYCSAGAGSEHRLCMSKLNLRLKRCHGGSIISLAYLVVIQKARVFFPIAEGSLQISFG